MGLSMHSSNIETGSVHRQAGWQGTKDSASRLTRLSFRLRAKKLPESGYFADADPHAEVYAPLGGVDQVDYTKRGGRYTSDFIWNTKWKDQLDLEISQKEAKKKAEQEESNKGSAGGLSFRRVADLNSLDVDLSEQLKVKKHTQSQQQEGTESNVAGSASVAERVAAQQRALYRRGQQQAAFERVAPFQGESRRWQRSGRFAKKVPSAAASMAPEEIAQREARAAEELRQYEALKQDVWRWSLGTTAICFAATYAFYTRDTAASYGLGAVGGLLYLRLLNRSVDGFGSSFLGAATGPTRFAIPVILALTYNRWNILAHEQTGVQLELLPMLLGFFTYKAGVVSKAFVGMIGNATGSSWPSAGDGAGGVSNRSQAIAQTDSELI